VPLVYKSAYCCQLKSSPDSVGPEERARENKFDDEEEFLLASKGEK
jgi:hypothetical protein